MDFLQASFLGLVQGFTEFLPISSSAHLILPSELLGWSDQGLTFDVALHLGTLTAVITYLRQDLRRLLGAWWASIRAGRFGFGAASNDADARLAWLLLLATVPGGVAGLLLNDYIEQYARSLAVIAATTLFFALLLGWSDRNGRSRSDLDRLGWRGAILIGCAQALALIPGTSRSGVTMTAALLCGLSRQAAARFSFLLAIPIILASALLKINEVLTGTTEAVQWPLLIYATVLSAATAFACIHFFLRLIERIGFFPFVLYRLVLGTILLLVLFTT